MTDGLQYHVFFTEIWLSSILSNSVVELEGCTVFRGNRSAEAPGNNCGSCVGIYINKLWCMETFAIDARCSADLEVLIIK